MDATFLNDLLECSVCLEQLDSTSKVLPCQHTFCKQCLEEIVSSHKELRCPECRVLVETKIDDLPCNILLIRLLDGIKNNTRIPKLGDHKKDISSVGHHKLSTSSSSSPQPLNVVPSPPHSVPQYVSRQRVAVQPDPGKLSGVSKHYSHSLPCAKALYSYEAKEPGDLSFKKGDIIFLKKRIDQNWYHGELNSKSGFLPASYVQVLAPISHPVPQCKALYDFSVSKNDEQDCLTFSKGDILTVIRRIDENWAEGKLGDKVGIFPVSFAQMNSAARTIMKLSANTFSGPSRTAPPTPSDTNTQTDEPTCASVDDETKTVVSNPVEIASTNRLVTSTNNAFLVQGSSSSLNSSVSYSTTISTGIPSVMSVSAFSGDSLKPSETVLAVTPSHSTGHSTPTPSIRNSSSSSLSSSSSSSTSSSSTAHVPALQSGTGTHSHITACTHLQAAQLHHHHPPPHNIREKRHSLAMIGAYPRSPQIIPGNSTHRHSMEILNRIDCCNLNEDSSFSTIPLCSPSTVTATTLNTATVATVSALSGVNTRLIPALTSAQLFQPVEFNPSTTSNSHKPPCRTSNLKEKDISSCINAATITNSNIDGVPHSGGGNSSITNLSCTTPLLPTMCNSNIATQPNVQQETLVYYVALYNYKPQKEDELELKKGEIYTVSEKCQDGWFKGTAINSAKSGVFPGNYVHIAKPSLIQAQFSQPSAVANVRSMPGKNPFSSSVSVLCSVVPGHSRQRSLCSSVKLYSNTGDSLELAQPTPSSLTSSSDSLAKTSVPMLKSKTPMDVSSASNSQTNSTNSPLDWDPLENNTPMRSQTSDEQDIKPEDKMAGIGTVWPSHSLAIVPEKSKAEEKSQSSLKSELSQSHTSATTSSSVVSVSTSLNSVQHSLDTFPSFSVGTSQIWLAPNSHYSAMVLSTAASAITPPNVSVGMNQCAKNSLPSGSHHQSGLRNERKEKKEKEKVSLMKRLTSKRKSRSPPPSNYSCDNPSFVDSSVPQYSAPQKTSAIHTRSGSCPSEAFGSQNTLHKKTSSLDGSSNETPKVTYKSKQPPPLVRERFRCIVPYPPNSEFELELKVGDMVYVHKKRDDGWYKGTLQRTGKTGLFPASFVDSCN